MKNIQFLTGLLALVLLLGGAIGPALAQDIDQDPPPGDIGIQGTVSNKFSFQGVLTQGGPVTGTRDMDFRLYSDATCTTAVSGYIFLFDVPVTNGVFSVELDFSAAYFNGEALWLEVEVDLTRIGCLEIMPVPYAFSLRPGATIEGTVDELLVLDNTSTSAGDVDTLIVRNDSGTGEAVEIAAVNTAVAAFSTAGYSIIAQTTSPDTPALLARAYETNPDLVLAGNANTTTGDDGILSSDPAYPSSDLIFLTNDGIRIELDNDGDGEDADIEIRDKDNILIFNIDNGGDVTYGGSGIAAFPRPAYDSGWRSIGLNSTLTLTHSLGGSEDNYIVDLTCKSSGAGINNWGVGGDANSPDYYGAWYYNLTTSQVTIKRWSQDTDCPQARIRIWMYP